MEQYARLNFETMEMISRLKIKVCSDKLVQYMEQLPYYTLVPGEVGHKYKRHDKQSCG